MTLPRPRRNIEVDGVRYVWTHSDAGARGAGARDIGGAPAREGVGGRRQVDADPTRSEIEGL